MLHHAKGNKRKECLEALFGSQNRKECQKAKS